MSKTTNMASPDPLSRWILFQLHPAHLDSVPGIDSGTLPEPFPATAPVPAPDPDPDSLPPAGPRAAGADSGFAVEPLPSRAPVS